MTGQGCKNLISLGLIITDIPDKSKMGHPIYLQLDPSLTHFIFNVYLRNCEIHIYACNNCVYFGHKFNQRQSISCMYTCLIKHSSHVQICISMVRGATVPLCVNRRTSNSRRFRLASKVWRYKRGLKFQRVEQIPLGAVTVGVQGSFELQMFRVQFHGATVSRFVGLNQNAQKIKY